MRYTFKTVSSLEKVLPGALKPMTEVTSGTMLKNEIHSFQLVMALEEESLWASKYTMELDSELSPYIKIYQVGNVPVDMPVNKGTGDNDFLFYEPGLAPDPLYRYTKGECHSQWRNLLLLDQRGAGGEDCRYLPHRDPYI